MGYLQGLNLGIFGNCWELVPNFRPWLPGVLRILRSLSIPRSHLHLKIHEDIGILFCWYWLVAILNRKTFKKFKVPFWPIWPFAGGFYLIWPSLNINSINLIEIRKNTILLFRITPGWFYFSIPTDLCVKPTSLMTNSDGMPRFRSQDQTSQDSFDSA